MPSHSDVHGNEEAGLLADMGQNLHPNNLLPVFKRRRVTEWDVLGSEPMEDPAQELTSKDDSGGSGMSEPDTETSSKGLFSGLDSDGFSTDVSDRADRVRGAASPGVWDTDYSIPPPPPLSFPTPCCSPGGGGGVGGPSLGQPKNFRCSSLCCCVGDCVVGHCHLYPLHSWQGILLTFAEMELDNTTMFPLGTNVMFIRSTEEPVLLQVVGHSEHGDAYRRITYDRDGKTVLHDRASVGRLSVLQFLCLQMCVYGGGAVPQGGGGGPSLGNRPPGGGGGPSSLWWGTTGGGGGVRMFMTTDGAGITLAVQQYFKYRAAEPHTLSRLFSKAPSGAITKCS